MKRALLFLILGLGTTGNAQTLSWVKSLGAVNNNALHRDEGKSIAVDASGNVYTTGNFVGTADFDPGPGIYNLTAPSLGAFVLKLDALGNFVWAIQYSSIVVGSTTSATSIKLDNTGNLYVVGIFNGSLDFDPGSGVYTMTPSGSLSAFITKLNGGGNLIWAKQIGPAAFNSLAVEDSTLYTTGRFFGTTDFDPNSGVLNLTAPSSGNTFIQKLDTAGNLIWVKSVAAQDVFDVVSDSAGCVYTVGHFLNTVDFDPGFATFNLINTGGQDLFILKLADNGNFLWAKQIDAMSTCKGFSLAIDREGNNVYLTGGYVGTADFDPGPSIFNLPFFSGSSDIFILKLTSLGDFVWAERVGDVGYEEGHSIALDAAGFVYITGLFYAVVDFDPGTPVYNIYAPNWAPEIFILKLDPSGHFVWAQNMGGTGDDQGHSLTVDNAGFVYTTGHFSNFSDFLYGSFVYLLQSAGGKDVFIHKLSPIPCDTPAAPGNIVGNTSVCYQTSETYSVPLVAGAVSYTWLLPVGWSGSSTTNMITTSVGSSGNISVKANSNCEASLPSSLSIITLPVTIPGINQNAYTLTSASTYISYQWYLNNSPIPGAIGPSHTATQNGTYYVMVTDSNSCLLKSNGITISSLDVQRVDYGNKIRLYPNPNNGSFSIKGQLKGRSADMDIEVADVTGKIVFRDRLSARNGMVEHSLELMGLVKGIYLVRLPQKERKLHSPL